MILVSNGGDNVVSSPQPSSRIVIGTVDGITLLDRTGTDWVLTDRPLRGCNFSAVTQTAEGTLFAASHGAGVARSLDGGHTWTWCNKGIDHYDLWSARAGMLGDKSVVCVGSLPAHLYISEDNGEHWRELTALRDAPSSAKWCFPPAPHVAHVKDICFSSSRLMVGIEIGALLVSDDGGKSFREMPVDPDPVECDLHRILVHPDRPDRIVISNGIVGPMSSTDGGKTWIKHQMPAQAEYPDAIALDPKNPDVIYLTAGDGWPPHWYKRGRARGKFLRSKDAGRSWERVLNGLPDGQRALFSALTVEATPSATSLYLADTDGQIFESSNGGDSWSVIADTAPVSKGEFYRALAKDRPRLASVDDLVFGHAATKRLAATPS